MPKSKLFWVGMLILIIMVPFIIIWIMAGLGWAIGMLVMLTILVLLTLRGTRRRRRPYYSDDYDYGDDRDININISYSGDEEGRPRRPSSFNRAMDWHVPKVNQKGAKFIADPTILRKRQEKDMRRIKKNLWG